VSVDLPPATYFTHAPLIVNSTDCPDRDHPDLPSLLCQQPFDHSVTGGRASRGFLLTELWSDLRDTTAHPPSRSHVIVTYISCVVRDDCRVDRRKMCTLSTPGLTRPPPKLMSDVVNHDVDHRLTSLDANDPRLTHGRIRNITQTENKKIHVITPALTS